MSHEEKAWNKIEYAHVYSSPGTSHDWRLRCGAVNLYHTLFGLTRPSCLPLPELGLVLNLKEKKAVLNPTIKSDQEGPELATEMVFTGSVSTQYFVYLRLYLEMMVI